MSGDFLRGLSDGEQSMDELTLAHRMVSREGPEGDTQNPLADTLEDRVGHFER
jgi:hypothetical protein